MTNQLKRDEKVINVEGLEMAYGNFVVMRDLNFSIKRGEIKVLMGGSGCGKSTLLRHLIGMEVASKGSIHIFDKAVRPGTDELDALRRRFGILFQGGALWSSMTVGENVALPLEQYTDLDARSIAELVDFKLSLVGLKGVERRYPSELSGGMRKRAGLARAIALDPEILFFDEPSAGLDPLSSRRLDDLILELRNSLNATIVMVTHELDSIFAIADSALFLDAETKAAIADDDPRKLRDGETSVAKVRNFLRRETNVDDSQKHTAASADKI